MAKDSASKKSVDEIILSLPPGEQRIVKRLRTLILDCLPNVTEKNSYGTPFYTRNRMMLFIWPPSLHGSPRKKGEPANTVTLGFCQGNLMSNEDGILLDEGRKQVYCMYINSLNDINEVQLRALFYEADLIDQQFAKKKRHRKVSSY